MEVMQKLTDEVYDKLFVTSDTHFFHNKEFVYKSRGYDDPLQMTEDMINVINSTVGEDGILLHLGDFCLNTTREQYNEILSNLKVKEIWMLWGNHNNPIQRTYGGIREQVCSYNRNILIRYLGHYFTFRNKKNVFVCFHFPIHTFDGVNHGSMHLCGHSHGSYEISRPENHEQKILDCGWDVHKKPLTMKEIETIMSRKNLKKLHHD